MKILIVCQLYYPENVVISKIAERLLSFGHDVTVLTGKPNYGYGHILPEYKKVKFEMINGVKVNRVNIKARKDSRLSIIKNYLSFWKNSKKWVRHCKEQYDIIYSMSISPVTILAAGNLYKKKHHVPHVVHCVDLWPESVLVTHAVKKDSFIYKMLYKWSRSLYSRVDKVLIGSPSFEEYFRSVLKLNNVELKYIPQPSLMEASDLEPYKFDKDYFNILYCGNLGRIQQIPLITEAMKELKDEKICFHIIGMGPLFKDLENDIQKHELNNVKYYGPIPAKQAAAYFKGADALYVSLKNDGYVGQTIPNKLVMSMAFEKPILAMLEGDGKKILEEADGAVIVDQTAESLKAGILKLSKLNKNDLSRLAKNNLTYYKNNLTIETVSHQVEEELKKNIGQ